MWKAATHGQTQPYRQQTGAGHEETGALHMPIWKVLVFWTKPMITCSGVVA